MRCATCSRSFVGGLVHPEGRFCGQACFRRYQESQARKGAPLADTPPRRSLLGSALVAALLGVAAHAALRDLTARMLAELPEPPPATQWVAARRQLAIRQVRDWRVGRSPTLAARLADFLAARDCAGHRPRGLRWLAAPLGQGRWRVTLAYQEEGGPRQLVWLADPARGQVLPASEAAAQVWDAPRGGCPPTQPRPGVDH